MRKLKAQHDLSFSRCCEAASSIDIYHIAALMMLANDELFHLCSLYGSVFFLYVSSSQTKLESILFL